MEVNQYLSMFIDESREHLQAMNENLLQLENKPGDIQIVHDIFRSAHTLKGMSATMGFEDLASLTHEMENVLDLVRNQKLDMNTYITDTLFKSFDHLEAMVEDIINGGEGSADVSENLASLQGIVKGDMKKEAAGSEASANPSSNVLNSISLDEFQLSVLEQSIAAGHAVYFIHVTIDESCVLKAARAYMVFNFLEQSGEIIKSSPAVEDIEQEQFEQDFSVYLISQISEQELCQGIESIAEIASVEVLSVDKALLKEMSVQQQEAVATAVPQAEGKTKTAAKEASNKRTAAVNRTIRVDIDRLDTLMNLFSELLIDRVRLEMLASEIKRPDLTDTVEHMARVSSDLQSIVLNLRMVPVESVFNRFPRMVRDIAKSLNKMVELNVTGAETELDRTVIDEIGDPLVHLLRNALDHGLEATADRIKAGKSETGTIHLKAFHSGNHVFIEISDDGKGIDRGKVLQKALDKQIVSEVQAEKMSDHEVYQLLFASGFSTAEQISDLSGRGVGLDVVRSKITSLGGQVAVESEPGKGTRFSVQLPLTLSIISAMLIRINDEKYAIPLSSIVETAIIQKEEIQKVHGTSMIQFRDQLIPVVSLAQVLDSKMNADQDPSSEILILVLRKGEKMAAAVVDEFLGQQEIVLKTLGNYLKKVFAVSGATILGDGQVALILDPNSLVK